MTESNTIHSETYLLLKSLLAKAETPITGRGVATVIEMEDGRILEGYNIENSETDIIHAEISALNDLGPQDGSIKSIHLMASGSMADIKKLPTMR